MFSKTSDNFPPVRHHHSLKSALVCALLVAGASMLILNADSTIASSGGGGSRVNKLHSGKALPAWIAGRLDLSDTPGDKPTAPSNSLPNVGKASNGASAPARPPCEGWDQVASPSPSSIRNRLYSVSALSANNVWASGGFVDENGARHTLVEHWDGNTWSIVPSPNQGTGGYLYDIEAVSTNNVWAVGITCTTLSCANTGDYTTLIEHWNGSAWSVVPGADTGGNTSVLVGISVVSANNIWALGNWLDSAFIEHWNGSTWSMVPIPDLGSNFTYVADIYARSSSDAWVVGQRCVDADCNSIEPIMLHWNGRVWSIVSLPDVGGSGGYLSAVWAISPNNVWAVGAVCTNAACTQERGLIMRYNGRGWTIVANPNPGSYDTNFQGVLAVSHNDIWASGSYSQDGDTWQNVMMHWDGHSWAVYPVSSPGSVDNNLRGMAALNRHNIWVVGDQDSGSGYRTQIQHFSHDCDR